jgi:thioredoxin-dependent peroxiredoxin
MRKLLPVFLLLVLAVPVVAQLQVAAPNALKVGDMAPDFTIPAAQRGQPGTSVLELAKTKNVLVMFFPAAFTQGCTTEFTQAGIHYDKFTALNVEMIGISRDQPGSLTKFKEVVGAKNLFVSDLEYNIIPKYGANNANRGTNRFYYLIDSTGKIVWADTSNRVLDTERLANDLAAALKK